MSLTRDVKEGLSALDLSDRTLKHFGFLVGSVALLLGLYAFAKDHAVPSLMLLPAGCLLTSFAFIFPRGLRRAYLIWMATGLTLGRFISRLVLLVLFYGIMTPIGLFVRAFGLSSLKVGFRDGRGQKDGYWITKSRSRAVDYRKMY